MKAFAFFASAAALFGLCAAQAGSLPQCAQDCTSQFLSGNGIANCGSDPKCICSNSTFISDIACCLAKPGGCDAADQSSAVVFASQICAAQGVTVPTAVSCTATSTGLSSGGPAASQVGSSGNGSAPATGSAVPTGSGSSSTPTAGSAGSSSSSAAWAPRETAMAGAGLLGGLVAVAALL